MANLQQTYRRLEPLHVLFALFWSLGWLVPVVGRWSEGPGTVASLLAVDAAGLVCVYLAAPAASVVVTSTHVIVRNPFRRYVVPRRLVEGVDSESPRLLVRNAPSIYLAALDLNLGRGYPLNAGRHQEQGVRSMLDRIPEAPSVGQVDNRIRHGHVVLAAVTAGAMLAAWWYLLSTR